MYSPFPGMDPYLELQRNWSDFHADLATEIRATLNRTIQPNYYARAVTHAAYDVIEISQAEPKAMFPDVGVWKTPNQFPTQGNVLVIDPPRAQSKVQFEVEVRLTNVEVRASGSDRLITAIEILSPVNKRPGREREKYLRKRRNLLQTNVHLMEIDLLRGGERSPLETAIPQASYYIFLSRESKRPIVDIWSAEIHERLPVIAVPLERPDQDVPLDLTAIVKEVYERGGYSSSIDYRQPVPHPALDTDDAAWVDELLSPYRMAQG